MELCVDKAGNITVVSVPTEELDASNAEEFKRDIAPFLETSRSLVIDLHRLRFVDSSGLGAFLFCLRKLNAKGGDLRLCGMGKQVRSVFELVRLHRIISLCDTVEDAVRSLDLKDAVK